MAKFIILTSANIGAMYVNVDKIKIVSASITDEDKSVVELDDPEDYYVVDESVSEIINLIAAQGCSS